MFSRGVTICITVLQVTSQYYGFYEQNKSTEGGLLIESTLTLSCRKIYMSYRTANLHMLHFIYYSTNIRTEYFKHAAHSPFFFSSKCRLFHNATFFGSVLFTFYIQNVLKLKKIPAPKG